jgi:DNA-directed RNA polymerase specialized sigma subunit
LSTPEAPKALTIEEANELVLEHRGWAESIARSVARAWDVDWQMDGLDGAAMEAIIFCSRRYDPARGVPFKGYARKRIHEASSDAARKSKGWHKAGSSSKAQQNAREVAVDLIDIFPELRTGHLPSGGDGDEDARSGIRQLLVGATMLASRQGLAAADPDELIDLKKTVRIMATLEPVHQIILWKIYWESASMRSIASDWDTDELNVIREHKSLLAHLHSSIARGKSSKPLRVRPGLKEISLRVKKKDPQGPFLKMLSGGTHVR